MLTSVRIENFKSYRDATLWLAPLTVMIGANASGKSNAIEALRLLAWVAGGNRLDQIRLEVQHSDQIIRGRVSDLGFRRARSFVLGCEVSDPDWHHFEVQLERQADDELHIVQERIVGSVSNFPLYEVVQKAEGIGRDIIVAYNNFARGGRKPQVGCSDQMAVLSQLQSSARFESGHKKAQEGIPAITTRFQKWLSGIVFLNPVPSAMRDYSFASDETLLDNGSNLSGVLFNLKHSSKSVSKTILEFVQSVPEQDITSMDFVKTPRGEVMVTLTETFGGKKTKYDATLLSDGTLRVLAIAAAMLSAPEGSLVVIEEIDNGVHPSRVGKLLETISNIAKDRMLRVLISSHNPALLDALPSEAVPETVFCYRAPKDGSSQLVRLSDVPDYPELIARGTIGHLMTQGALERFVKEHPGPEKRRKQAMDWLESLGAEEEQK
jgi:predicted ATPase